jgi:hypothetical protein
MSSVGLLQPILGGGLRTTNFFNGRLLSAEDLTSEQASNQQARARLARAIGDGIVFGLEVRPSASSTASVPSVTVQSGLAINRLGHVLALDVPETGVDVTLVRPSPVGATQLPTSAPFSDCLPPRPGVYVAGTLVYLLVLTPAAGAEGRLPVSGVANIPPTCNTRFSVEGVQFRLLQVDVRPEDLADTARSRNLAAHACFGTGDPKLQALRSDPFGGSGPAAGYGLLDELRDRGDLTDCDVPLGLLHWTADVGIDFVDMWAARRRLVRRGVTEQWPLVLDDRRAADAEATFLQFQAHLADLRASHPRPPVVAAGDVFRYLPPVGVLPVSGVGAPPSFDYATFFGPPVVYRGPAFIEGARVEPLMREALMYAPIDLQSNPSIWLYRVRENAPLPTAAEAAPAPAPFIIFTSGHVPFQGQTRFDEARWDYGIFES